MKNLKLIVILVVLLLICIFTVNRYELVPSTNSGFVYRIDHLSGAVLLIYGNTSMKVEL